MQAVLKCTRLLVGCLACLAAPEGPRPRARAAVTEPCSTRATSATQEVHCIGLLVPSALALRSLQARYPQCPPYLGYRRDLVATLASLSHGNPGVVREIVAAGTPAAHFWSRRSALTVGRHSQVACSPWCNNAAATLVRHCSHSAPKQRHLLTLRRSSCRGYVCEGVGSVGRPKHV